MRAIRLLNLRRLVRQPLRAVIAVVAVTAGVSLAVSVLVVMSSINSAVVTFSRAVAGPTPLRVVGAAVRGGLEESVVAKVEATPGVTGAVPMVQTVAMAEDARGAQLPVVAFGVDCRVEKLFGALGCDPAALAASASSPTTAAPLISASLARRLGSDAHLRTDLGRVPLSGAPAPDALDRLNDGRVVVFPLPIAQLEFVRPGRIDVIYVTTAPGAHLEDVQRRLERAVGPHNGVLRATDAPAQAGVVTQIFIPLLGMVSLFSLGVGAVLVYNTVALSLEERRRQLAIVGALGGSPRRLLLGTLVEAGVLGLIGGLLGTVAGALVARPITAGLNDFTQKGLGLRVPVHVSPSAVVIGAALGVLVSVVASIVPARRALRMDVAAELSNRELRSESAPALRWRRAAIALVVLVAGLVLGMVAARGGGLEKWQAVAGPLAFLVATLASVIAAGALAPALVRLVARLLPRAAAPTRLGLSNLIREPGRTGVMAVAVSSAVGISFVLSSFSQSVRTAIESSLDRADNDWVWVSTLEPNNTVNIDSRVSPDLVARVRAVPGVASVEGGSGLITGHTAGQLIGIEGRERLYGDVDVIDGTADTTRFQAGEVLIGPSLARATGARAGDRVTIDTPTGRTTVPVMGVWQDGDYGGRNVTMTLRLLERLYGPQPSFAALARPAPGLTVDQLARRITAAGLDPFLQVRTPQQLSDDAADDIAQQLASFWAIQRSLLLVAFVAVLSTLLLVGAQRRRELALLAAVGMQPGEMARMVVSEAGTVAAAGVALGVAAGAAMSIGLISATIILIGYEDPLTFDVFSIPAAAAIAVAVVILASGIPAWRTSRLEVVEALQYE
ncbi:MAG: putative transport system permease protein [Actinomycetota bacterium]|jgi:putative ABC transport system permease protein